MADQGLLGQSKPAATTNTVLYSAPIDASASAVLHIMNDGTGAAYDLAIKDSDQKLTLDASTHNLHKGDLVTGYRVAVNTPIAKTGVLSAGQKVETDDKEKDFYFESFYIPTYTEIFVKKFAIRSIAIESITGTFVVGETISTATSPNDTVATVYGVSAGVVLIGPSTINGSGSEFAAGNSITASGGATATISTGGVGTANNEFTFSTTTAGGTYNMFLGNSNLGTSDLVSFKDRAYRFNVADASMNGLLFRLSTTINGEYGPDNDAAATADNGTEYTTGKTTNGTAGNAGAYIQYDLSANASIGSSIYFYDGNTGSNAGAGYGGHDRFISISSDFTFKDFYIYNKTGTLVNSTDSFTISATTYTITGQTTGPYGYIRSYSGTTAYVIKGTNSADFAGSDTFQDSPKLATADRGVVTVSSVTVAATALENENYITKDKTLSANATERITSLVIGPGERLIIESATQNNVFNLIGFEDGTTSFPVRTFGAA